MKMATPLNIHPEDARGVGISICVKRMMHKTLLGCTVARMVVSKMKIYQSVHFGKATFKNARMATRFMEKSTMDPDARGVLISIGAKKIELALFSKNGIFF